MANHRTMPLSGNGFTPLDCQCFKTNHSFKHRNAFYKNEAIIRLSSHHTMQHAPEDRVLPYNGQNMLGASKTNHSFKHRNVFYKNEAIIRLSSNHTMQRKPEDRVLPYNGQNMIDTTKTKAFDIITSVYMFQKQFQIISINHKRH